ncbi:MAG: hypothetical protein ACPL5I_16165 [Thermodesulfobacteriota bacterium]
MKFIKKFLTPSAGAKEKAQEKFLIVTVQCARCGEVIQTRVDLENDLSAEYGERESETTYFCRKMLVGKKNCYAPIEVELTFDNRRQIIDRAIKGGNFAA